MWWQHVGCLSNVPVIMMAMSLQETHSPTFDVSTAIHVCRQANYHRHALALAKKYGKHDSSVELQLFLSFPAAALLLSLLLFHAGIC